MEELIEISVDGLLDLIGKLRNQWRDEQNKAAHKEFAEPLQKNQISNAQGAKKIMTFDDAGSFEEIMQRYRDSLS